MQPPVHSSVAEWRRERVALLPLVCQANHRQRERAAPMLGGGPLAAGQWDRGGEVEWARPSRLSRLGREHMGGPCVNGLEAAAANHNAAVLHLHPQRASHGGAGKGVLSGPVFRPS